MNITYRNNNKIRTPLSELIRGKRYVIKPIKVRGEEFRTICYQHGYFDLYNDKFYIYVDKEELPSTVVIVNGPYDYWRDVQRHNPELKLE